MVRFLRSSLLALFILSLSISSSAYYVWNQKANFGGTARHRGSAFVIGNKGYMGLGHINGGGTNILFQDFWEYEPASNTWTQKADFGGGLRYHTISFSIGDKAYVGTGRDQNNMYHTDLWEYNAQTNSWTQMANLPGPARRGAVGFSINNKGYIATGQLQVSPGQTNDLWEYNPVTNSWTQKAPMPTQGRYSAVSFSIAGLGYVGTGWVGGSGSSTDLWEYNPQTDSWTQRANIGTTNRMEATAFALKGKGYIGTGDNFSSGTNYGDMWEFDPDLNTCTQIQDFPGTKRRYMLSFVIDNKAYAGIGTNGTNFNDFWEMSESFVGVDDYDAEELDVNIYPNPCRTQSTVEISGFDHSATYQVSIFDLAGKKVKEIYSHSSKFTLLRDDVPNGLYLYQVTANHQLVKSGKIIFN